MYISRLLAINMATLAVLGTLLLGMVQENMLLPMAMAGAAALSVWINDITGLFRLSRRLANVGMAVALYVSIAQILGPGRASLAIYFANLLAYVQIILFFVEKDTRVWWHLALLSLIQVCVAATYAQQIVFGGLLVVYMLLGLTTMVLIYLQHERSHYRRANRTPTFAGFAVRSAVREKQDWFRLLKIALVTCVTGPLSLLLTYGEPSAMARPAAGPPAPDPGSGRWPLAGQVSTFTSPGGVGTGGVGWELWFRMVGMTGWTLLLAALVFVTVPRMGFQLPLLVHLNRGSEGLSVHRSVGFDDNVRLGSLGYVIEDPDKVLSVQFLDQATGDPYPVNGEIYLRGAVLTRYKNGNWGYDQPIDAKRYAPKKVNDLSLTDELVLQEIMIEPMLREEVFCVWPLVILPETEGIMFHDLKQRVLRDEWRDLSQKFSRATRLVFRAGTTAFQNGSQAEFIPADDEADAIHMLSLGSDLPSLVQQAQSWIDESGVPETNPIARARVIESQLRDSGSFRYQLSGVQRESGVDPIEDFVANNRKGHCEYFSTALALMLRSQDIPTRMIVGYKTGGTERAQSSFQFFEWDAHTWVEAYISPDQVRDPGELPRLPNRDLHSGGWLRLDPTPAAPGRTRVGALAKGIRGWPARIESAWRYYVIGMNKARQRELVYDPLAAALKSSAGRLADPDWWRGLFREFTRLPGRLREWLAEGRWVSWRGGLVAMVLVAMAYAAYRATRLLARLAWSWGIGRAFGGIRRRRARVKFYRRLEAVMKRHGLNRPTNQTHREFATEARQRIAQSAEAGHLANLPGEITEAFYHVRFGGTALDSKRTQEVEHALGRLEESDAW